MSESIRFDQAADYYDRTRALPDDLQGQVTAFLTDELRMRQPVLEVGVGTGRMALPLAASGIDVVGVDLSEPMLRRLVANAAAGAVVPIGLADGRALPFADATFGAAYLCHVLHLIPDWPAALAEMVRVVRPGGRLLIDIGGHQPARGRELFRVFEEATGQRRLRPGIRDRGELDSAMAELDCVRLDAVRLPYELDFTVEEMLERWETNQWSSTWSLSDDVRQRGVAEARAWAEAQWGDVTVPVREELAIVWHRFETPA